MALGPFLWTAIPVWATWTQVPEIGQLQGPSQKALRIVLPSDAPRPGYYGHTQFTLLRPPMPRFAVHKPLSYTLDIYLISLMINLSFSTQFIISSLPLPIKFIPKGMAKDLHSWTENTRPKATPYWSGYPVTDRPSVSTAETTPI